MVSVYSALILKNRHQFVVYNAHSKKPYTPNTIILRMLTLLIGCDWYIITSQSAYLLTKALQYMCQLYVTKATCWSMGGSIGRSLSWLVGQLTALLFIHLLIYLLN
jgi:hypothetical protein